MTRRMKLFLLAAALLLLMGGVYAYTHRDTSGGRAAAMAPQVAVERLVRRDMEKRVVLSGETVPKAEVEISPKYAGRIAEVLVDLGDAVAEGDVLLRQDSGDVSLALRESTADAVEAEAVYGGDRLKAESDYENAKATYERYEALYGQGAVALQDRDDKYRAMMEARAALDSVRNQDMGGTAAVVASKRAAADALRLQERDMDITAPVSGVIGYRAAEAGEWASAGQKLFTVVDRSAMYVDCVVAEQDVGILRVGMQLPVTVDSIGETLTARLTYISPAMDAATHSYVARLVLENPPESLRGGMFARMELTAVQRKETFFVPKEAVGDDNGKKYIFLIKDDGTAKKVYVTLGLINDESIELTSGAREGETVAVTNIARLRDGVKVEIET